MKLLKINMLFLICTLFTGCINFLGDSVQFETVPIINGTNLPSIPSELIGEYIYSGSTDSTIEHNLIFNQNYIMLKFTLEENNIYDTIFFKGGDNTHIIKKGNKVFFNTQTNIGAWKILFAEYDSVNAIRFCGFKQSEQNEFAKYTSLKTVRNTSSEASDTLVYILNPTPVEFEKILSVPRMCACENFKRL